MATKQKKIITCQQPSGCERSLGGGSSRLDTEELNAPAHCVLCGTVVCDDCVATLDNIPVSEFPKKRQPVTRDPSTTHVFGWVCSDHFNEDWA